jgi:hypothetical protein
LRHALQTKHFDRSCRSGFSDRLATIVEHRSNLAGDLPDNERLVNLERSCWTSTVATAPRPRSSFASSTTPEARRVGLARKVQNV